MIYQSKRHAIVLGILFSAIAVVMVGGLSVSISDIVKGSEAEAWPTTKGSILISKTQLGCGKGSSFYPFVEYEYTVESHLYTGNRIAFGNVGCGSESSASEIASQYPVGATVLVHYDPATPRESVLMAGHVLFETWLGVVLLSAMLVGSITFIVAAVYQVRADNSRKSSMLSRNMSDSEGVLGEAEILIAYGRKKQAIALLERATIRHGDNSAIRERLRELKHGVS